MTAILRLQLDDKDPVRVNSAINQLAEVIDRGGGGGGARTFLTANTTFYVSTIGSDTNSGTSVGSPFLTIQRAIDVLVGQYDTAGNNVTIQIADGTYTAGGNFTGPWVGGGTLTITGNASTPANVFVSVSVSCFVTNASLPGLMTIQNMKLKQTITDFSGACIMANATGNIAFKNIIFDASFIDIYSNTKGSLIYAIGNYSIIGGGWGHLVALVGGSITVSNITVTISGTPAFSSAFAYTTELGLIKSGSVTWSGSATGQRYLSDTNAVIHVFGAGVNYFPGNVSGTTSNGGFYG